MFSDLSITEDRRRNMRGIVKGALLSGLILGVALVGCSRKIAEVEVKGQLPL